MPREADPEGRIEKYIGVKVKACVLCRDLLCIHAYIILNSSWKFR